MREQFTWDPSLSTGDLTIDDQHRRIIDLANEILTDLKPEDVKLRVLEIYRYTREHFHYEEELMRDRGFPGFQEHQHEHNTMISQINELVGAFQSTSTDCVLLQQFIAKWVREHVLQRDKLLTEFLSS